MYSVLPPSVLLLPVTNPCGRNSVIFMKTVNIFNETTLLVLANIPYERTREDAVNPNFSILLQ